MTQSAAQLRAQLAKAGLVNPLPALAAAGAAYLGALIAAVVVTVVMVIGIALSSGDAVGDATSELVGSGEVFSGIGAILRLPFQLVALGVFGSYGFRAEVAFIGDISMSARMIPLLVTAVFVAIAYIGGRIVRRNQPAAGPLGIAASSLLGGLAVALVVVIIARITAQPLPTDEFASVSLHAAGIDAFLGAFVLAAVGLALGQLGSATRPAWWPVIADIPAAVRLAAVHAVTATVVLGAWLWIVHAVQSLFAGEFADVFAPLAALPLLVGQAIAYLAGFGMFSGAVARVSGEAGELLGGGSLTERVSMFDLPWYSWLVMIVLSLATTAVISMLWSHGRQIVPGSLPAAVVSWAALPAAYFAGSLVLMIIGHIGLSIRATGLGYGAAGVGLAGWTPLLAILAGVLVEVLSRFMAPFLTPVLPPALFRWFRRPGPLPAASPAVAAAPAAPAEPGTAVPAAADAHGGAIDGDRGTTSPQEGSWTSSPLGSAPSPSGSIGGSAPSPAVAPSPGSEAQPAGASGPQGGGSTVALGGGARALSPRARKGMILGGIGAGALVVLIGGIAIAVNIIGSVFFSPDKQVEAYLTALESGNYGQAVEVSAPNVSNAQRVLLTDELGAATEGGLTSYTIGEIETEDDEARVTVTLEQDGVRSEQDFTLTRSGTAFLIFPQWTLDDLTLPELQAAVPDDGAMLEVNGVAVDLSEVPAETDPEGFDIVTLPVLPGNYTITYQNENEFLDTVPSEFSVPVDSASGEPYVAWPAIEINDAGEEEIQRQVTELLDECATQTDPSPDGCPFSTYLWSDESGSWEITGYPDVVVENIGEGQILATSEFGAGEAEFTYEAETFGGDTEERTDEVTFTVNATVTFPAEGGVEVSFEE